MKVLNQIEDQPEQTEQLADQDLLLPLVVGRATSNTASPAPSGAIVVGELIGIANEGCAPLVVYPGQTGSAAIRARSVVDLHEAHIGGQVVLMFEAGDPGKPIIMGFLREVQGSVPLQAGNVDVDSDGERMIVSAKTQLVLRCGKASITLTKAGKVLIEGAYVSSRSSGVNRLKGGSVQLN